MNITLEYSQPGGRTRRVWLSKDQVLRFGRSNRADVVIATDSKLAEVHFEVTGLGHEWRITSVGSENVIFVNGSSANYHLLVNGDLIQAGGTVFRVTIEGMPAPIAVPAETPQEAPPAYEPQPIEFSSKSFASKLVEFTLAVTDSQLITVLNALASSECFADCQMYCALNAKRLGRPLLSLVPGKEDLFSHAPDEIRETDSLAIVPVPMPLEAGTLNELAVAGRANAAFLVLSPQPLSEYLDSHKLVWGWYGRPSILHQQGTLGSSVLAEKLLVGSEVILLLEPAQVSGAVQQSGLKLLVQKSHSDNLLAALQAIMI